MENTDKEKYAASLAANAEKAMKIVKIIAIVAAVCAVVLPVASIVLLLVADKALYGLIGLGVSVAAFVAMFISFFCANLYVRKQLKDLKELDAPTTADEEIQK